MHRLAPIVLLGGVLLFASGAEAPASPDPVQTAPVESTTRDQVGQVISTVTAEVARLKARAESAPAAPKVGRDPFRFGRGLEPVTPVAPLPAAEAPVPEPVVLPRLVALLETASESGVDRSASLALDDVVRLARAGDTVGRFTIESIGADVVVVRDVTTSAVYQLTLR